MNRLISAIFGSSIRSRLKGSVLRPRKSADFILARKMARERYCQYCQKRLPEKYCGVCKKHYCQYCVHKICKTT